MRGSRPKPGGQLNGMRFNVLRGVTFPISPALIYSSIKMNTAMRIDYQPSRFYAAPFAQHLLGVPSQVTQTCRDDVLRGRGPPCYHEPLDSNTNGSHTNSGQTKTSICHSVGVDRRAENVMVEGSP
jgi:hypothetical protein